MGLQAPLDAAPLSPYVQGTGRNIPRSGRKEGRFLRLFLTLLALLTGLATADRAVAAPATPAAMGALALLADTTGKAEANDSERRPTTNTPPPPHSNGSGNTRKSAPPKLPGLLTASTPPLQSRH